MEQVIRILIVDDHIVVRQGYSYMLKAFGDLELVGEAESAEIALEVCKTAKPDVILMDIHLKGMNGIEAIKIIKSTYPHIKIIALTSFENETSLVQRALEAGANGFVYKSISVDELSSAIRKVCKGDTYLTSDATRNLVYSKLGPQKRNIMLTDREYEVLKKLSEGLTNGEIADELRVSTNTVKFHIRSLLRKFDASTRTEVVSTALQYNMLN